MRQQCPKEDLKWSQISFIDGGSSPASTSISNLFVQPLTEVILACDPHLITVVPTPSKEHKAFLLGTDFHTFTWLLFETDYCDYVS